MQQENKLNLSSRHEKWIVAVILCISPLAGMTIDLIAPSLPAISHGLQISAAAAKNLISIYLLGMALGNFFIGFLSDSLGRRKLGILGSAIFTLASLFPAIFSHLGILFITRFLQGFTLGAVGVVARAILADILPSQKLIRIAPMISTMWGIGPIVGPVIGGYLQYYINWQAGFYFFAIYGFIILIGIIRIIPETHFHRQILDIRQIKNNFLIIVKHRIFMGAVILAGLGYSLLVVFNILGPFLIQTQWGYTSIYFGHIALWMGVMFLLGTITCRYFIKQYTPEVILWKAIRIFLLVGIVGVMFAFIDSQNIWVVIIPSLLMFFGCGVIFPAGMGYGMSLFRHLAGSSSAVMSFTYVLIPSLVGLLMSFVLINNAIPMMWMYLGIMLFSGLIYWLLIKSPKSIISEK